MEGRYIVTFLLALIPAIVWSMLFLKKYRENWWTLVFTFIGGILAAQLILLYKGYWDHTINLIFAKVTLVDFRSNIESLIVNGVLATFVTFLGIGAMEEFGKFIVMKAINKNAFRSIDDVISLAIITALGFSFYENMIYFNQHWGLLDRNTFAILVLSRVTVVTMVHMLCSGLLGYYFGLAHFASPVLRMQHAQKIRHPVLRFFKNILHMRKTHLYRDEMMVAGLVVAMVVHAMYDFILSSTINVAPIVLSGTVLLYFFGGYYFLSYLLQKKEHRLQMGLVSNSPVNEED